MKLTEEEKELILKKREEEEAKLPKFKANLKHDLFCINAGRPEIRIHIRDIVNDYGWYTPQEALDKISKKFNERMQELSRPILKKGAEFVCYIENGFESWYDYEGWGVEERDSDWAKQNLENIRPYKKANSAKSSK